MTENLLRYLIFGQIGLECCLLQFPTKQFSPQSHCFMNLSVEKALNIQPSARKPRWRLVRTFHLFLQVFVPSLCTICIVCQWFQRLIGLQRMFHLS